MLRLLPFFFLLFAPLLADEPSPVELERQEKYIESFEESQDVAPRDFSGELWTVLSSLLLIIGFLIGGTWVMKKLMTGKMLQMNQTSAIKILDQRNLSTKTAVYIIEIYDKHIVVGETAGNVTALAEFPVEEERPPFEKLMNQEKS